MKVVLTCVLMFCFSAASASESDYETYINDLSVSFEAVKKAAGLLDQGSIFTKKVIDESVVRFKNDDLYASGLGLIVLLRDSNAVYGDLDFRQWEAATYQLLEVDDWNASRVGWGNYVIKTAILSAIFRSIQKQSERKLSESELMSILRIISVLRKRLPSERGAAAIAVRNNDIELPVASIERLDYKDGGVLEADEFLRALRKELRSSSEKKTFIEQGMQEEGVKSAKVYDYSDLYATPLPWTVLYFTHYKRLTWDFYMHFRVRLNGDGESWGGLSEDAIKRAIKDAVDDGYETLIPDMADLYLKGIGSQGQGKGYVQPYVRYIRRNGDLKFWGRLWASEKRYSFKEKGVHGIKQ